jgi:ABC-type transport system substrate-binding protein/DNA-binding SARP family transcriptional activator
VEFRVLGAFEVLDEGNSVPLGGRKQRSLLAILLLRANKVVSSDALIDELWGERPPASAQHTLQAYVSRLRKVLRETGDGRPVLVSYPAGYLLRVASGELDLDRFEHLAEEGRRALAAGATRDAAATCRAALSLWSGPALADLRFEPFARVDAERLEERRLAVLEDRIQADLQLGRHVALVAELEALVAEHPLRERLREDLMLALYGSGRRAEALEAYRSARSYLVQECGLEPGKQLQALHRAILHQDPQFDPGSSEPASVLTTVGPADEAPRGPDQPVHHGDAPDRPPESEIAAGAPVGRRTRLTHRRRAIVAGVAVLAVAVVGGALVRTGRENTPKLPASAVQADSVVFVDARHAALIAQTDTGGRPSGIASGFGRLWITDSANGRVLVLDPSTFRIEDQIPLGRDPTGLAASANGIWVIDPGSGTVSEISSGSHTVVATVPVGASPVAIAAGAGALWVADASSGALSRIDPNTASVVDTISVGQPLTDLAVGLGSVWITSATSGQLIGLDPRTDRVTQAVAIGNGPASVAVIDGAVWVANPPDHTLSRFDPGTGGIRKLNVSDPVALTVAAGALWVADGVDSALERIDPATGKSTRIAALANPPSAMVGTGDRLAIVTGVSPAEHRGGALHVVAGDGVDSIDPGAAYSANDWQLLSMTNDGLLTYARASGPGGAVVVPDLATSLPVVDDGGRTFTFTLRRGVHYSNGAAVRPVDFRRALERQYQAGTGFAAVGVPLAGATGCGPSHPRCDLRAGVSVDDAASTVTYHLTAPDPAFPYQLALPFGAAVPSDTPDIGSGSTPVPATGPYRIASYLPNRRVELVRNPAFRPSSTSAQPDGFPAQISLQLGLGPATQAAEVAAGRADVMLDTPPAGALRGLRRDTPQQLHTYSLGETDAMFLNTRLAPFNRPAVRQAIALAVDRARLVDLAGGPDLARPTCQVLPPGFPGYYPYCTSTINPGPAGDWHGPALSRARALIAGSGTAGTRVTVSTVAQDPFKLAVGRYFVGMLDALGYRASLRTYPHDHSYYEKAGLEQSRSQIGFFGWEADYPAGSAFFEPLFTCVAYRPDAPYDMNPAGYCDPQIDDQISRASSLQTVNVAAANRAWRQLDTEVTQDAPWIPLVNPLGIDVVSARVGNYQRNPVFGVLLDQLWVR